MICPNCSGPEVRCPYCGGYFPAEHIEWCAGTVKEQLDDQTED